MKVPITVLFVLTCLTILPTSEGQQRSQRSQARSSSRLKIKNVIREDDGSRIQCLSCSSDFTSKSLDITDSCYNPNSVSIDKVKHSLITLCPPESLFCKVEINRVGGVFAGISRSCGGNYCVEACFQRGYGAELETCTFCCGGVKTDDTIPLATSDTNSTVNRFNCP